ncbi:MAG: hypothetical protein A2126_02375 [Candidatus Woykebacteria bacterium GWB1_45_5]|uniref:DUF948 domain-containing protein n=2 Tax=Candidatus Woykeibacteriota TaxID=1817899 RepID=A0A1G1W155_9BACT|nr:MAG: hypothetical protein A2113_00260 [Candidatus Woykebacteria bacterium GWA1_44_8]OGY23671.1 MAG: hypothetical protein A2126_02375 [Candidatus Woykebacteria bacterium GWB1_45_5]
MDTTAFLTVIIILVAVVLIVVGIYLIIVLNEARASLRTFNAVLNRVNSLLEVLDTNIARPASSLVGVLGVVKEIIGVYREFKTNRKVSENGGADEPQQ